VRGVRVQIAFEPLPGELGDRSGRGSPD